MLPVFKNRSKNTVRNLLILYTPAIIILDTALKET